MFEGSQVSTNEHDGPGLLWPSGGVSRTGHWRGGAIAWSVDVPDRLEGQPTGNHGFVFQIVEASCKSFDCVWLLEGMYL